MAYEAAIIQYRKEQVAQFQAKVSQLKAATTKESVIAGQQATFLVSGANGDTAVTRGSNGLIPYGNPQNSQVTATLVEKHAPYELTNFNIFVSQGDQKRVMQESAVAVINRDIDLTILAELANCTIYTGSATTASLDLVMKAKTILGNNQVPVTEQNNMFAVISPAFDAYLMQTTEYSHADYIDVKPFSGPAVSFRNWAGINWYISPLVTGVGTSSEACYMFHRNALGYAVNMGEENVEVGYDAYQHKSWARATVFHGAKILQNTGIVKMVHDGSAYVTS